VHPVRERAGGLLSNGEKEFVCEIERGDVREGVVGEAGVEFRGGGKGFLLDVDGGHYGRLYSGEDNGQQAALQWTLLACHR